MKICLINCESYLLVNEKICEIIKESKNVTTFDLNNAGLEDVILEAGYFSMFEEEKYIIVKNATFFGSGKLSESDTELLINYMKSPNENTTIIFICSEKIDARKKVTKLIKDNNALIVIPNLKYYEIENRVQEYYQKKGYKIALETVKYIVSNCLNNYDIVMNEVNKIALFYNEPGFIKHEDVVKIVSKSLNTNNFLFIDALVYNDLETSFNLLNDLKALKVEPTALIALISRDFRIMLQVKTLLEQNKREYEIMKELNLMDWQLEKYLKKIFPYKIKELENIILRLAKLDLDIKSGKIDKFIGLELFILELCE